MPHEYGEAVTLMVDFGAVMPAREVSQHLMPDPALMPALVPEQSLKSEMEVIEGEFDALKHSMASLEQKYIALETAYLALKSTLDKINVVLVRKLGPLD